MIEVGGRGTDFIRRRETRAHALRVLKYGCVSGLALVVDFAAFLSVSSVFAVPAALAAVIGYLLGGLLHYAISVAFVFDKSATGKGHSRLVSEYLLTGVVGAALTAGIVHVAVNMAGLSLVAAKLVAMVTTFITVYCLRLFVVFAPRRALATS